MEEDADDAEDKDDDPFLFPRCFLFTRCCFCSFLAMFWLLLWDDDDRGFKGLLLLLLDCSCCGCFGGCCFDGCDGCGCCGLDSTLLVLTGMPVGLEVVNVGGGGGDGLLGSSISFFSCRFHSSNRSSSSGCC